MSTTRRFTQVDVFTNTPLHGNPLAVVHDAIGLTDAQMQHIAAWTNLSETSFLLPPTDASTADYRVRIFTTERELPFAGHPTLGSCHAWLAAGGQPRAGEVVQECGAGLVRIRRDGERLAFAAPPLLRSGAVAPETLAQIARSLRVAPSAIMASQWVDNGPGWVAVMLASRAELLAVEPDYQAMRELDLGVVAPCVDVDGVDGVDFEVRAFVPTKSGGIEDPVTGSLNAGLAQWLIGAGLAPERYTASQGTALGRAGRVHVERVGEVTWIGGDSVVVVRGEVTL